MTGHLSMPAIALCLSAVTLLLSLRATFTGQSRHLQLAGLLISVGLVTLSAGEYFGLVGRTMSSVALLSGAFNIAGVVFLYKANKKRTPTGTA